MFAAGLIVASESINVVCVFGICESSINFLVIFVIRGFSADVTPIATQRKIPQAILRHPRTLKSFIL